MKTTTRRMFMFLTGGVAIGATFAAAQDWPQWRGANRDANAGSFTAPKSWPKELAPKWKIAVGEGDATPVLVGGKLYVFARQQGKEITRCLDATDGKEIWKDEYDALGATGPASGHSGPRSSPTIADGKVVTLGVRGMVSCLDAATGKKIWRKDDFQDWPRFFTSSSPLIVDGLAIAQVGGPKGGAIVAYDLATGDEKWKWTSDSPAYASPVLMTVGGTKVLVAQTDKNIVALGASSGKPLWQTPFAPQGGMGYNASTPLVDGETLIYGGQGRGIKAVKMEKQGDVLAAKNLWSNSESSVQFNTPVLKKGLIFGLTQANQFFCIKAADGQTAWTAPVGPAGGGGGGGRGGRGGGYGSIVAAGSVLLALTPASELIVFEASDKQYNELARIKVAETPTYAYPIVSGNKIFIKDQESLALYTVN